MLLDTMSKENLDELREYIYYEVDTSEGLREEFTQLLRKWEDQYDGNKKPKTFPFERCSNIKIPYTASNCDAIHARIYNSIFAQSDFVMAEPLKDGSYEGAKELQDFLKYALDHVIDIKGFINEWASSMIKKGTGIAKIYWKKEYTYSVTRTSDGSIAYEQKERYNAPKVESIPLHDFLRPVGYRKIQDMPWCGNRFRLNHMQLKQYENDGYFKDLEKVLASPDTGVNEVEEQRAANVGYEFNGSTDPKHGVYEFWEISLMWEVDGVYIPLFMVMHPATKTIVHLDYYPYKHCRWMFVSLPFLPREGQLEGIGVCAMLADVQEGLDTMVNQSIDNATLANCRVFLANRSITMNKSMRVYPGAIIPVNSKDDLVPLSMGDIYPSSYNLAQMIQGFGERRSGLNEYLLGRENASVGTKATATGTVALIQEGSRRFDFILMNVRKASREIIYQCLELWQQYSNIVPYLYQEKEVLDAMLDKMGGEQQMGMGQGVWKKFNIPEEFDFRSSYMVELEASKATLNKEVEKQNLMNLFQVVGGYYQQFLGLVGQVSNPNAPIPFKQAGVMVGNAGAELLSRIIDTFDIKDKKMLIPKMGDLNNAFAAQQQQQLQQQQLQKQQQAGIPGPGPNGLRPVSGQQSGMGPDQGQGGTVVNSPA